jgi:hypothetical protein
MRGVPLQNSPQLTGNRTPLYDLDFTFILTCQGRTNSRQSSYQIHPLRLRTRICCYSVP